MMGYSQSNVFIALLLFSMLIAMCAAVPAEYRTQDLTDVPEQDYMAYEEVPMELPSEGTDEPNEEKRAVFRMGKRAMMRFGKRAMMRFGKRSVFRLG